MAPRLQKQLEMSMPRPLASSRASLKKLGFSMSETGGVITLRGQDPDTTCRIRNDKADSGFLALNTATTRHLEGMFSDPPASEYNLQMRVASIASFSKEEGFNQSADFIKGYFGTYGGLEAREKYEEVEDTSLPEEVTSTSGYLENSELIIDAANDHSLPKGKNAILQLGTARRDPVKSSDISNFIKLAEHFNQKVAFKLPEDQTAAAKCKAILVQEGFTNEDGVFKSAASARAPEEWHGLVAGPENAAKMDKISEFIRANALPVKEKSMREFMQDFKPHTWEAKQAAERMFSGETGYNGCPTMLGAGAPKARVRPTISADFKEQMVGIAKENCQKRLDAIAAMKGWTAEYERAMRAHGGQGFPPALRSEMHQLNKKLKTHPRAEDVANQALIAMQDFVDTTGVTDLDTEKILLFYFARRFSIWRFANPKYTWITPERLARWQMPVLPNVPAGTTTKAKKKTKRSPARDMHHFVQYDDDTTDSEDERAW